jgi:energy-coupling factor transporter ATP-binding protein EcfA2
MASPTTTEPPVKTAAPTPAPGIVLPTAKIMPSTRNPKNLVLFSKPKVGKTTLFSALDNCLVLDLEEGSDYVEAMKIKASSVADIANIGRAILAAGKPYKYIAVDTITALQEICIPRAEELYSKTLQGKNWYSEGKPKYRTIINLPNGAGYAWLRAAFEEIVNYIKTWAPHVILVGHIKDTLIQRQGAEFNSSDLNLTGQLKSITTSKSDAIGYMYRKGNQNIVTFRTSDEVACGARPEHLKNQEIVISEIDEKGNMVFHWDKIYKD